MIKVEVHHIKKVIHTTEEGFLLSKHPLCDTVKQSLFELTYAKIKHKKRRYYKYILSDAPLDDFIRGLQVLKCLSNFNCYSS